MAGKHILLLDITFVSYQGRYEHVANTAIYYIYICHMSNISHMLSHFLSVEHFRQ